jgi:hypothetical protein
MRSNLGGNSLRGSRMVTIQSARLGIRRELAIIFLVGASLLPFIRVARAQERWAKAAPLPEISEEFSCIAANGKIYLIGGSPVGDTGPPRGLVQEYNPATDAWVRKKPMPVATHHAAIAEYHGKIYVMGGAVQLVAGGPNQFQPATRGNTTRRRIRGKRWRRCRPAAWRLPPRKPAGKSL